MIINRTATTAILVFTVFCALVGCNRNRLEEKGFVVSRSQENDQDEPNGISQNSLVFATRPSNVLLTGIPKYRLATIYKVNYNRDSTTFIGSNDFHYNYESIGEPGENQWHSNYLPGLEAVYGYNLVNVSHYDVETQKQSTFFEKPVLIKTFYYPSFSRDTLNYKPVNRNFFLASVYDEDTNHDGYINVKDLRRFYAFDINANNKRALIPKHYSVYKSEYDPANDLLNIFAQNDANKNGQVEDAEEAHIFWIDLKNPDHTGRLY